MQFKQIRGLFIDSEIGCFNHCDTESANISNAIHTIKKLQLRISIQTKNPKEREREREKSGFFHATYVDTFMWPSILRAFRVHPPGIPLSKCIMLNEEIKQIAPMYIISGLARWYVPRYFAPYLLSEQILIDFTKRFTRCAYSILLKTQKFTEIVGISEMLSLFSSSILRFFENSFALIGNFLLRLTKENLMDFVHSSSLKVRDGIQRNVLSDWSGLIDSKLNQRWQFD